MSTATEIVPNEGELVLPSDASRTSVPVSEEKVEFDDLSLQHDEVGLNPIEDIEVLEKILNQQNSGCCDTTIEAALKKLKIPESVIERLLCQADKRFCTIETTAWMQEKSGYNFCGNDDFTVVSIEEDKSTVGNASISVAENDETDDLKIIDGYRDLSANDDSVAVVSVEGEESQGGISSRSVSAKDEGVALVSDEDAKVEEERILEASVEAKDEIPEVPANDVEYDDAINVSGETVVDAILESKDESPESPTLDVEDDDAIKVPEENLVEENPEAKDESAASPTTDAEDGEIKAKDDSVVVPVAEDKDDEIEAAKESNVDDVVEVNDESVLLPITDDANNDEKVTDESNVDTSLLINDEIRSVAKSVEMSDPVPETMEDEETGFECVLEADFSLLENSTEHEEAIKFSPPKKKKKIRLSKISKKISSRISKSSSRLSKRFSSPPKMMKEQDLNETVDEEVVDDDIASQTEIWM